MQGSTYILIREVYYSNDWWKLCKAQAFIRKCHEVFAAFLFRNIFMRDGPLHFVGKRKRQFTRLRLKLTTSRQTNTL